MAFAPRDGNHPAHTVVEGTEQVAEIKVLSTNGVKALVEALAPRFEQAARHRVVVSFGSAVSLTQEIEAGAAFDLAILTAAAIDDLAKRGKLAPASVTIARSGVGVAVRVGAPKPDIGTADALKRALLAAKSVAHTTQGASGVYFETVLIERLGIAAEIKAKARTQPGGLVGGLVASGEAELAVQQISELLAVDGIDYVGPLPPELQHYTVFTAALSSDARQPAAAKAFIDFLTAPSALRVIKAKGMEPG
jgi:molybdate transport system substrate-binding protein